MHARPRARFCDIETSRFHRRRRKIPGESVRNWTTRRAGRSRISARQACPASSFFAVDAGPVRFHFETMRMLDAAPAHRQHRHKKYCHGAGLRPRRGPRRMALRPASSRVIGKVFIVALALAALALVLWLIYLAVPNFPNALPPPLRPNGGIAFSGLFHCWLT